MSVPPVPAPVAIVQHPAESFSDDEKNAGSDEKHAEALAYTATPVESETDLHAK